MPEPQTACRLYVIQARSAPCAVILRRGPSKQVRLIRWDLSNDTLLPGQWLAGRIYERRADLSPDGQLFVYLAAKPKDALGSWTAVSRPPFLTALALWRNLGTWGGGGLFDDDRTLGLNVLADGAALREGVVLPKDFQVRRIASWGGRGEDDPIETTRLERDGWLGVDPGQRSDYLREGPAHWVYSRPQVKERLQPGSGRHAGLLRRERRAIGVTGGAWYLEDFVVSQDGQDRRRFVGCDWADWQANGDLLLATGGGLYRLAAADATIASADDPLAGARCVAQFADMGFTQVPPPDWAREWP